MRFHLDADDQSLVTTPIYVGVTGDLVRMTDCTHRFVKQQASPSSPPFPDTPEEGLETTLEQCELCRAVRLRRREVVPGALKRYLDSLEN